LGETRVCKRNGEIKMENTIKITKDLKFNYWDLMKIVDVSQEFTLRDVLRACVNSSIPMDVLCQILQCSYIVDYWDEAESKPFTGLTDDRDMEYLELYWGGSKQTYDKKRCDSGGWSFHGMGREGYVPEDMAKYGKWKKGEKKHYRQAMAIEFSPMYTLADYPIRICKKIYIEDEDLPIRARIKMKDSGIDYQPTITLMELLYAIFWELSFCGSPKDRDGKMNDLKSRMDEIDKAKKEGRLDEITVPWEKVKRDMKKKIKETRKASKKENKNGVQLSKS